MRPRSQRLPAFLRPRRAAFAVLLLAPLPVWALVARDAKEPSGNAGVVAVATDGTTADRAMDTPGATPSVDGAMDAATPAADRVLDAPTATPTADATMDAPAAADPTLDEAPDAPALAAAATEVLALDGASSAAAAPLARDAALRPLRQGARPTAFRSGRVGFALSVDGRRVPYEVMAVPALPGETVTLEVGAPDAYAYALAFAAGEATSDAPGRWSWTAPATPGIHAVRVHGPAGSVHLNVMVMHPAASARSGRINGYDVAGYRKTPLRGDPVYLPPEGFVEVRGSDADVLLSPHLTLGQFRCKQPGDPKYVHVTPALLDKLEALLDAVNRAGYPAATFHVMSGFRTPAYNRAIGNTTSYSRHLWGDAADVWIDADGDGEMDDWNRDGRVDREDARILLRIAESVEGKDGVLPGGLGLYRRNAVHGPFVHVDARGYAARW